MSVESCSPPSANRLENWTRSSSVKSRGSTCFPPSRTTTSRPASASRWASTDPAAPLPTIATSAVIRSASTSFGELTSSDRQLSDLLHRLREALALRERHIASGRRAARVGVVADDRQLLGGGEQRLDEPAELPGQPALDDVGDEAALDEGEPRLGGHEGERGPQPEERIDREHREDELRLPFLVRGEGVEVVVDPLGDLFGGEHLLRADHEYLGHRHRRVVLMRPEVTEAVPPLDRRAVEQREHHRHRGRRRGPEQQLQGGAEAGAERGAEGVRDAVVVAEREHQASRATTIRT